MLTISIWNCFCLVKNIYARIALKIVLNIFQVKVNERNVHSTFKYNLKLVSTFSFENKYMLICLKSMSKYSVTPLIWSTIILFTDEYST